MSVHERFQTGISDDEEVYKVANILVCDDDKDIVEAISIYLEQGRLYGPEGIRRCGGD